MNAFFYFPINVDLSPDSGIVKKNEHIVSAFRSQGVHPDVVTFSYSGIHLNGELFEKIPNLKLVRGIYNYVVAYTVVAASVDFSTYKFAWIRAGVCLPPQLFMLKEIKRKNPDIKILLEYGSYPYDSEYVGYRRLLLGADKYFSKELRKCVSFAITYCGQSEIHGIPTVKIGNGIDVAKIRWTSTRKPFDQVLRIVSVSSMNAEHALDRVIAGLQQYYMQSTDRRQVVLDVVGDGPERGRLEQLVASAGLEKRVTFHGFKIQNELNEIFDESHLAIGTLGMHRTGLAADSSLKNREYFARGFPFVLATSDADFPAELPFVKYVPSDESPIDIESLVDFYEDVANRIPDFPERIRRYAEEHLTWNSRIKHILDVVDS